MSEQHEERNSLKLKARRPNHKKVSNRHKLPYRDKSQRIMVPARFNLIVSSLENGGYEDG